MTDWDALSLDVPRPPGQTYLNSCSMGLPDRTTLAALHEYGATWSARGAASWGDAWLDALSQWRRELAALIGTRPDEVAWCPSVGAALGSLGSALLRRHLVDPSTARQDLVLGDLEFPSALAGLGQRPGTITRWATSQGGRIPTSAYTALLGPATETLLASRVLYTSGAVQDVATLCAAARQAGAFSIVDDYQGLGQLTLDLPATGADAAVGGSLKWLCGGVASAWMYVRRDRNADLQPMHAGWWANSDMLDFRPGFKPWPDARRFEGGEVNVPGLLTSLAAIRRLSALGPGRVARRVAALATDLRERLADAGLASIELPKDEASAIVVVPRRDPADDVRRLDAHGIVVDHRKGALRVSPHHYNTQGDNERFVAALSGLEDPR